MKETQTAERRAKVIESLVQGMWQAVDAAAAPPPAIVEKKKYVGVWPGGCK